MSAADPVRPAMPSIGGGEAPNVGCWPWGRETISALCLAASSGCGFGPPLPTEADLMTASYAFFDSASHGQPRVLLA
jgi:hypothetical protein